jgi:hypothetical protein
MVMVIFMPLFPLGKVVVTPGALRAFTNTQTNPVIYLNRHNGGDWGELDKEDQATNAQAITNQKRILSAYTLRDGTKFWIITEGDRSVTTFLLPEEY